MQSAEELVQQALPSILEGLKTEIKQTIDYQVKSDAARVVSEHVTQWIKENILPELTIQLIESKDGLMQLGAQLAPKMVQGLTSALAQEFSDKLGKSWERSKIFDACFK